MEAMFGEVKLGRAPVRTLLLRPLKGSISYNGSWVNVVNSRYISRTCGIRITTYVNGRDDFNESEGR